MFVCAACGDNCDFICGDGFRALTSEEKCDDGNTDDGDGCAANCAVEVGWMCTPKPEEECGPDICDALSGGNTVEPVTEYIPQSLSLSHLTVMLRA